MNARLAKLIPHYLVYSKAVVIDPAHMSKAAAIIRAL
jgi:hypothetical protein